MAKWVNAHIEIVAPLIVSVNAPAQAKIDAVSDLVEELIEELPAHLAEHVAGARWEDVDDGEVVAGEKENVYRELERTQHKCARLKGEVNNLRAASTAQEAKLLRREAGEYRKALSNILYRLDNGSLTAENLRSIIDTALTLKALKQRHRDEILVGGGIASESRAPQGPNDSEASPDAPSPVENAVRDALSALGTGNCKIPDCEGCEADTDAARQALADTGLRPSGFSNWSPEAQQGWLATWAPTQTADHTIRVEADQGAQVAEFHFGAGLSYGPPIGQAGTGKADWVDEDKPYFPPLNADEFERALAASPWWKRTAFYLLPHRVSRRMKFEVTP